MRCGDGAAQRIVHRGGKGRCRRRLARARFEADAEIVENVVGVMPDGTQPVPPAVGRSISRGGLNIDGNDDVWIGNF